MPYEQFGGLKYRYRNRELWCRGYCVDTTGKNTSRIAAYIKHRLKHDQMTEQLTIPGLSPFTGGGQQPRAIGKSIARLPSPRGSEDFARTGTTAGLSGGCLFFFARQRMPPKRANDHRYAGA